MWDRVRQWLTLRRFAVVLALTSSAYWAATDICDILHQPTRIVGTVKNAETDLPAKGVNASLLRSGLDNWKLGERALATSDEDGVFELLRQVPKSTILVFKVSKRGYEPQVQRVVADRNVRELDIKLTPERDWNHRAFFVKGATEYWDGEDWCDGTIELLGGPRTPTPEKDTTGQYLVSRREHDSAVPKLVWMNAQDIRPAGTRGNRACLMESSWQLAQQR